MANPGHLKVLKQGVHAWNEWKMMNPSIGPDLNFADLRKADYHGIDFSFTSFFRADLEGANLSHATLNEAIFKRANLSHVNFSNADLQQAHLRGANLSYANLCNANLYGANLSPYSEAIADFGEETVTYNTLLVETNFSGADLDAIDLSNTDLTQAYLYNVSLDEACLTHANLSRANLSGVSLNGADLSGIILTHANLSRADLRNAQLVGANLSHTNLEGAFLQHANLTNTYLFEANCRCTNVTGSRVYGMAPWGVELESALQKNLIVTKDGEPEVIVDTLEVAQFIYLFLNHHHIRRVISTVAKKLVFILGHFTPERKAFLDMLRDELRRYDYAPITFNIEKTVDRSQRETIGLLGALSRFIIADLTGTQDILQELIKVANRLHTPIQPLVHGPEEAMDSNFKIFEGNEWILPLFNYQDIYHLSTSLEEYVIKSAEQKIERLQSK